MPGDLPTQISLGVNIPPLEEPSGDALLRSALDVSGLTGSEWLPPQNLQPPRLGTLRDKIATRDALFSEVEKQLSAMDTESPEHRELVNHSQEKFFASVSGIDEFRKEQEKCFDGWVGDILRAHPATREELQRLKAAYSSLMEVYVESGAMLANAVQAQKFGDMSLCHYGIQKAEYEYETAERAWFDFLRHNLTLEGGRSEMPNAGTQPTPIPESESQLESVSLPRVSAKREKPPPTPKQIQDNAKTQKLMAELGWTQTQLSRVTGYSQGYLSEVYNGKNNAAPPLPKHLALLAGEGDGNQMGKRTANQLASVEDRAAQSKIAAVVAELVSTDPASTKEIAEKTLEYVKFLQGKNR